MNKTKRRVLEPIVVEFALSRVYMVGLVQVFQVGWDRIDRISVSGSTAPHPFVPSWYFDHCTPIYQMTVYVCVVFQLNGIYV